MRVIQLTEHLVAFVHLLRSRPYFRAWRSWFPATVLHAYFRAAFGQAPFPSGARADSFASAQAASAGPRVAPGLQRGALEMSGGFTRVACGQAASTPSARSFRCAADSSGIRSSVWLATESLLWANGGLTIHSTGSRFAAPVNSGVRPLTKTHGCSNEQKR